MTHALAVRFGLLLAVLTSACAAFDEPGDTHIDIVVDPCEPVVLVPAEGTRPEELAGIAQAAGLWNDLVGSRFTLEPTAGAPSLPIEFREAPLAFYGVYEDERGLVLVNRNLTDPQARAITIAHELGHAMGLFHDNAEPCVMNETNLTVPPQAYDATALERLWGRCQ